MGLGITVNAVNPGVTDTGWVTDAIRARRAAADAGRAGSARARTRRG